MAIIEVIQYSISCNTCYDELPYSGTDIAIFETAQEAIEASWNHDWTTSADGKRHYCDKCSTEDAE